MINILIDTFPKHLEIDGKEYAINTDYRYALNTMLAFEDAELTIYEKVEIMLRNLYGENVPENVDEALEKCQYFLNVGSDSKEEESHSRKLYSFSKDAGLIYAAFQATHGINLSETKLHWWRFINLFMDLGQDTTFCQLVSLRKRYYSGKCTKEEKQSIREMWSIFEIKDLDEQKWIDEEKENFKKAKLARNLARQNG